MHPALRIELDEYVDDVLAAFAVDGVDVMMAGKASCGTGCFKVRERPEEILIKSDHSAPRSERFPTSSTPHYKIPMRGRMTSPEDPVAFTSPNCISLVFVGFVTSIFGGKFSVAHPSAYRDTSDDSIAWFGWSAMKLLLSLSYAMHQE